MNLSLNFVKDYIDLDNELTVKDIAEAMTKAGNEYDSAEKLINATKLVIGEIKECEMHPDSDHLHLCKVDIGSEILNIVCGAPNARKGIKVIVAQVGAELPGDFKIKKGMIRGQESNGMLCALYEIGIDKKFLSEEDKNGIHELPADAPVGGDPIQYMGLDDGVIDFELTANRGDLLSILGMAYELGAIYDKKVKPVEHRLELKKMGSINIIDDAYNSNPVGSKMALDVLKLMPGKKIIVTPGMIEMGSEEYEINKTFGKQLADACDEVILIGEKQTKPIYDGLIEKKYPKNKIHILDDVKLAFPLFNRLAEKETYVLLENDLPDMIRSLKGRIHFAHVRNLKFNSPTDFEESAHLSSDGSFDMYEIMKALYEIGFDGPIRPDHGRMIWGEVAMPGYGLYDRALGAAYLNGLWEAIDKNAKRG